MSPDPELSALACTWKEMDMPTLALTPSKLSHTARWEGRLGVAASGALALIALGLGARAGWDADPRGLAVAVFVGAVAVVFGRAIRGLRRETLAADGLLTGTAVDVARGHRRHVHARLCAVRSPVAVGVTLAPVVLVLGLAALGERPDLVLLATTVGYAGWIVWMQMRTAPALRAELVRLDAVIAELEEP